MMATEPSMALTRRLAISVESASDESGGRMEWLFDGLGTMILGLILGAAGGGIAGWNLAIRKTSQRQRAGDNAQQTQAGRDIKGRK